MSAAVGKRGGVPVGYLWELSNVEATAVLCLRLWNHEAQDNDFPALGDTMRALGPDECARLRDVFEQICALCARHGRRPLVRHSPGCDCLGADEACFANFIATASEGDREDAMLIASMLVRADMAPGLASLAESFGLSLKRMSLCARDMRRPCGQALH
ncbi:hypothetical protein DZK27_07545 [Rhodobacteraceae bacterium 63075]|nr:hypothetical protein DZK27_07545 [Rhodobacteraceae bacterium 63075]